MWCAAMHSHGNLVCKHRSYREQAGPQWDSGYKVQSMKENFGSDSWTMGVARLLVLTEYLAPLYPQPFFWLRWGITTSFWLVRCRQIRYKPSRSSLQSPWTPRDSGGVAKRWKLPVPQTTTAKTVIKSYLILAGL